MSLLKITVFSLLFAALLSALPYSTRVEAEEAEGGALFSSADYQLQETADAGEEYLAQMVFFGESTTAHLTRRGGIWDTPQARGRVLRDASGTRTLNARTADSPVLLPSPTGAWESVSFLEAVERMRPRILVLSFGLNGLFSFCENTERYTASYERLIRAVHRVSPETRILLQTVYPVCRAENFSADVETVNACIAQLNAHLPLIAARTPCVRVADTASVLRDGCGRLLADAHVGDGIHLTDKAYARVLAYLRTHAWLTDSE